MAIKPTNKLCMRLMTPEMMVAIVAALQVGVDNYGEGGYLEQTMEDMESALLRHLTKMKAGESLDSDSGLPHTWHIAATAAIMAELDTRSNEDVDSMFAKKLGIDTLPRDVMATPLGDVKVEKKVVEKKCVPKRNTYAIETRVDVRCQTCNKVFLVPLSYVTSGGWYAGVCIHCRSEEVERV